jgi:hypothetical protein
MFRGVGHSAQLERERPDRLGDSDGQFLGVVLFFAENWIDFHSLLRINGVWKITNKTATHSSR